MIDSPAAAVIVILGYKGPETSLIIWWFLWEIRRHSTEILQLMGGFSVALS